MAAPEPGSIDYYREALDYIDGHAPDSDESSRIAEAALAGTWRSPECCNGHGLERRSGYSDREIADEIIAVLAPDFDTDTEAIRRWISGESVTNHRLVTELRRWADYLASQEG